MVRTVKWSTFGLVAAALALSVNAAQAQVNATVVLKSGERQSGHNVSYRIDRREVSFMGNQAQRFNVDQVAFVDYGGNADGVRVEGNQEAVVLRDGTVLRGSLIELNHGDSTNESTPYLIIFKTDGGEEKRLPPSQVARVYFSGGAAAVGTSGSRDLAPATGDGVVVSAQQKWTPSGLTVRKGDRLNFTASGEIQLSADGNDVANAGGAQSQRKAAGSPLPNAYAGALIGRVGTNGPVFAIGRSGLADRPGERTVVPGHQRRRDRRQSWRVPGEDPAGGPGAVSFFVRGASPPGPPYTLSRGPRPGSVRAARSLRSLASPARLAAV